ncbi:glutamate N-acetyltransferase [Anaerosporobacter mobilis DSM 15930]|jgi:glutamate N-acetyltransferase/amino-acid N-acetyltransferase|uniref:Arginine biosynthesis bifunctional protein ArgJ n=1 Tax=Anaerosporobacter mobilis DSM 15930 TaxID=1120996 RepID=A0A1M7KF06_9FIRM|nr:bifunctional glutamate N-acetyltransferase/amino-acid acetyltransferase ArgJ [Anaerosporobacter mobilis]SHM63887.1 glutamate N-acetyltransferase [Anaerosporobacter mobilis DSM 15930]
MKIINGGVTAAKGYQAASVAAGIKYQDRKDMALIYSEVPCTVAGTFTRNIVKAAPVRWDQEVVKNSKGVQAIIVNSGIANACTGAMGMENNKAMAEAVAEKLKLTADMVLTASTGVIGKQLNMEPVFNGINQLVSTLATTIEAGTLAAEAIMTTDTCKKELAIQFEIDGKTVTVGGMSKGSGMIHPNMGTMLAFLTSDVAISKELLQEALYEDVQSTYNMISIDGDTSTNDSCFLLANGLAGNTVITTKDDNYYRFVEALNVVNTALAKQMAGDGEGATKLLEVKVVNAVSKTEAITLSKSVATSSLVKTAVYGNDANWGRILCALGYAGVDFDPEKVDLYIESVDGKLKLVEDGIEADYSEEYATKILSGKEVCAIIDMKMGEAMATAWGCDLTYDYIKINADYRS